MDFRISNFETRLKKLSKLDTLDNLILILVNGAALLISIINAYMAEKDFTKLGIEVGVFTVYLISSFFIYKKKNQNNQTLYRLLCVSSLVLIAIIDTSPFHSFHILFIFFLSLNLKKHMEVLFYPFLLFNSSAKSIIFFGVAIGSS